MLTATDLTGEETQDKRNPRFLLLMLALFIMAGIGYAAFWWIEQREKIVPIMKEEQVVDESAQAWYEEQRRLMESRLNIAPVTDSSNHNDSTIQVSAPLKDSIAIETVAVKAEPKPTRIRASYPSENMERAEAPRKKIESRVDDNIRSKSTIQYWDEQTIQQTYNGSIPPTNNRRPASQYNYSEPVNNNRVKAEPKSSAPSQNSFAAVMITREELEEFMRQFPYKKTTIQFVTYNKPTEGTEAIKAQIIQFLRQQGYTDIEVNWNIWYDHTPVKEVHYGKYGMTGASFYIPVLK